MSAKPEAEEKPKAALPKPKTNPTEQFVTFVAFIAGMVILIDPAARTITGTVVGAVLEPLIGFGKQAPIITLLLASLVMVAVTSGVRHYFTDYLKVAKAQEVMKAFSRELRTARKENNLHKMKKLTEKQKDLMSIQAEQSSAQLKPMAITMVVVIPIFAWLLVWADPGSAVPDLLVQQAPDTAPNPWATTPEQLEAGGMPTVAQALRAPDIVRDLPGDEYGRLAAELRNRGTDRVLYESPLVGERQYVVAFPNPPCETHAFVPWSSQRWCLDVNVQTQHNPTPLWLFQFFPRWVALYSLFSIPLGQVVQRVLKARDLQAELAAQRGA